MIGRLTGTLVEFLPGEIVLDVAGVGYELRIPLSTFYALGGRTGSAVSVHVHTHVREDALQLFGFASPEERDTFEKLISISGVGPRMALAILSGIGVDELRAAVARKDRQRIQKIPGVGKKTAERVLLELHDKLAGGTGAGTVAGPPTRGAGEGLADEGLREREDAVSALINLGYSRDAATRAVDSALDSLSGAGEAGLEAVLRTALGGLVR